MSHYPAILSALVILPLALQAKPLSDNRSGTVRFTGAITTPACVIKRRDERLILHCFGNLKENRRGDASSSLRNMPKEFVSAVTSEIVNNDPRLKRVTVSYK